MQKPKRLSKVGKPGGRRSLKLRGNADMSRLLEDFEDR